VSTAPRHRPRPDSGFSLAEIMVVILLMGIVMFIGVGSFQRWALASAHEGAAVDMQTVLRQTHVRAVTEGISYCITFDTDQNQYTLHRYACGTATEKVNGPFRPGDARITLNNPRFRQADGTYRPWLTFRPSGVATEGTVVIRRAGEPKAYTVSVEGFTGRVDYS
jgi:prepilin-type N-terminal cleavage/methylation domain-containing protein